MKKRGQIRGEAIKYILIALVIIVIQFVGYKFFTTLREKQCQTELAKFEIDLKGLDKGIEFGSVDEREHDAPCDVDKIYFIDLDKEVPLDIFNKLPIIKDSLKSKVKKNVFLVKDNKILRSFYAGNLDFEYPYHTCFIPRSNKIYFFIESMGLKVKIIPGCTQPECTYIPTNISEEEARLIIADILNLADCKYCPTNLGKEITDLRKALNNVNIFRKFKYCSETGITEVEIIIKPKEDTKLKNFRFYEYIPKECIEDLNQYLAENIEGEVHIEGDPLIVWQFDIIDEETTIDYKLSTKLTENCKRIIEGLGVVELVEGKAVEIPEAISTEELYKEEEIIVTKEDSNITQETETEETTEQQTTESETTTEEINNPPKIENIPDKTLDGNRKIYNNIINLILYVSDDDTKKSDLIYRIISQSNEDLVSCSISPIKRIDCKINKNEDGSSEITVEVEDDTQLKDSDSFKVIVNKVCEASCGECIYENNCTQYGNKTCTNRDCSTYTEECMRYTNGVICGDNMICQRGECISTLVEREEGCRTLGCPGILCFCMRDKCMGIC